MILPGHAVNDGESLEELPALGSVAGVDFAASEANVSRWGGSVSRYRHAVRRALDQLSAPDAPALHCLGSIAAWRAGVLGLRRDALCRMRALVDAGQIAAAAAALGLPPDRVDDFRVGQQASRLAWPLLDPDTVVVRVGGFRGLGGTWLEPPRRVWPIDDRSGWLVPCGPDHWLLEADVFGSRLTPWHPVPEPVEGPPGVIISEHSYLVWITGRAG